MKRSNKQYAQALYTATGDTSGKDLERVIKNFVLLLHKNRKIKQVENIITEFIKYAKKQEGIIDIEITSARKLDKTTLEKIKEIFGKKTISTEKENKGMLGGIIIKTEDVIFDGSVKTQLTKLKQKISN